jgi:chemotaxis protein CheX
VCDAIGELTNMVAGSAKAELDEYQLSVSLPNVVTGVDHDIRFPTNVTPLCVPFATHWGPLSLEVGLVEVRDPVAANGGN